MHAYRHRHLEHCGLPDRLGPPSTTEGGLRILVVEPDAAAGLASLLRHFGHQVELASDREVAWQAALRDAPDVVLLDLAVPGSYGRHFARQLQEMAWVKKPFVIALAGWHSAADQRRAREVGIDLHLVKPVDPGALQRLLTRFKAIIGK